MRRAALFAAMMALAAGLAAPAGAEDSRLTELVTGDDTRGWEAVGRLDIAGRSFCTGALVAPDQVLTAAHCLFDKDSGSLIDPTTIQFMAGLRNGRAAAYRGVRRAVVHPGYSYDPDAGPERVRFDLALLELSQPIRNTQVVPFNTDDRPRKGDEVGVVSYAHDRADAPSLQEVCHVLARQSGVLVLSCAVDFGSSGAPIFALRDGEPRIVSVVSAKAEYGTQPVSLGTSLTEPLADLRAALADGQGVFQPGAPAIRRIQPSSGLSGGESRAGGAKFLRP